MSQFVPSNGVPTAPHTYTIFISYFVFIAIARDSWWCTFARIQKKTRSYMCVGKHTVLRPRSDCLRDFILRLFDQTNVQLRLNSWPLAVFFFFYKRIEKINLIAPHMHHAHLIHDICTVRIYVHIIYHKWNYISSQTNALFY